MHLTSAGILIIPASLLVLVLWPSRLGQWAILVSALGAASVLNVGGGFPVGITPYFFVGALIAARIIAQMLTGRLGLKADEPTQRHVRVLVVFVAWAVVSALLLPILFSGMPVDIGRAGVDATYFYLVPLHWSFSNVGQAGYLVIDLCVVLCFLRNAARPGYVEGLVRAFTWCGLVVTAVGVYQLLSYRIALPFPNSFFYSNKVWAQLNGEGIAGNYRINATFPEASSAGDFFAMWAVFELIMAERSGRDGARHWWYTLAGSFMVVTTTSTTGYLAVGIAWSLFIWKYFVRGLLRGRVAVRALLAAVLSVAAVATAFLLGGHSASLLDTVVLNKMQSGSAVHRLASVYDSIGIFCTKLRSGRRPRLGSRHELGCLHPGQSRGDRRRPHLLLALAIARAGTEQQEDRPWRPPERDLVRSARLGAGRPDFGDAGVGRGNHRAHLVDPMGHPSGGGPAQLASVPAHTGSDGISRIRTARLNDLPIDRSAPCHRMERAAPNDQPTSLARMKWFARNRLTGRRG